MTDVLDRIEAQLVEAAGRAPSRRRFRRAAFALSLAAVASAVAGAAVAVSPTPLERLFDQPGMAQRAPGTPRTDVTIRVDGGARWRVTSYVRRDRGLATAAAFGDEGTRIPPVGWASGFVIAANRARGGPASWSWRVAGDHALAYGTVDAAAESLSVVVGGRTREATLSSTTLTVPVDPPRGGLTPEGRRLARTFPSTVTVRTYAAAFEPGSIESVRGTARATLVVRMRGGRVVRQRVAPVRMG